MKSVYSGCGVYRRYCFPDGTSLMVTPFGKSAGISSAFTDGRTMQSPPACSKKKDRRKEHFKYIINDNQDELAETLCKKAFILVCVCVQQIYNKSLGLKFVSSYS